MARFRFRLATLLRLREQVRDDRRRDLAEAYRVDQVLQEQQEQMSAELDRQRASCRQAAGPGPVNIDQLVDSQRYEAALKVELARLQHQRQVVAAEIERRHRALVEANHEVRVLEKLRERQAEQHRQDQERLQMKQLDEIAQRQALFQEADG